MIERVKAAGSLCQQLVKEQPALAKELGLNDADSDLPEVICDLLSDPSREASATLGRAVDGFWPD